MTTYNTGNPIGSTDPRDLKDNAENLDELVNSTSKDEHTDRLGVQRKTWNGMEEDFQADQGRRENEHETDQARREDEFDTDQASREERFNLFIANSGYQFSGDYEAGIQVNEYNEVVRDSSGNLWRLSTGTSLPYTTTGAGLPEGGAFVPLGDADLRQDLAGGPANGDGALRVRGSVVYVDTIADLKALPGSEIVEGQLVEVTTTGRAGAFYIHKTGTAPSDPEEGIYAPLDSGGGYAERIVYGNTYRPEWFGADYTGAADSTDALNAAEDMMPEGAVLELGPGQLMVSDWEVSKRIELIFRDCELLRNPTPADSTFVLHLNADGLVCRYPKVNGNRSAVLASGQTGRQVLIRIGSNSAGYGVELHKPHCYNPVEKEEGNEFGGIEIQRQCYIYDSLVEDAARCYNIEGFTDGMYEEDGSGKVIKYETAYIFNPEARNFGQKGFVTNGDVGMVHIVNAKASFDDGAGITTAGIFLGETGEGKKCHSWLIENSFIEGTASANFMKFVRVKNVTLRNCDFTNTSDIVLLRTQDQYAGTDVFEECNLVIDNCRLRSTTTERVMDLSGLTKLWVWGGVLAKDVAAGSNPLIVTHGNYTHIEGSAVDIAEDNLLIEVARSGDANYPDNINATIVNIKNVNTHSIYAFRLLDPPNAGQCKLVSDATKGSGSNGSVEPTELEERWVTIQRNLGEPRVFFTFSSRSLVGDGWRIADQIWHVDQSSGDAPGRIVVTAGDASTAVTADMAPLA